jgi:hypothetical protein
MTGTSIRITNAGPKSTAMTALTVKPGRKAFAAADRTITIERETFPRDVLALPSCVLQRL